MATEAVIVGNILKVDGLVFGEHTCHRINKNGSGNSHVRAFMTLDQVDAFSKLCTITMFDEDVDKSGIQYVRCIVAGKEVHVYNFLTVPHMDFECEAMMMSGNQIQFILKGTGSGRGSFTQVYKDISNRYTKILNPHVATCDILRYMKKGWIVYGDSLKAFIGLNAGAICRICLHELGGHNVQCHMTACCKKTPLYYHAHCLAKACHSCPGCAQPLSLTKKDRALLACDNHTCSGKRAYHSI